MEDIFDEKGINSIVSYDEESTRKIEGKAYVSGGCSIRGDRVVPFDTATKLAILSFYRHEIIQE